MIYAHIGITVLWIFYFVTSSSLPDFGAGFFALHSKITGEEKINHLIHRYLNPVWEVTNVFLYSSL